MQRMRTQTCSDGEEDNWGMIKNTHQTNVIISLWQALLLPWRNISSQKHSWTQTDFCVWLMKEYQALGRFRLQSGGSCFGAITMSFSDMHFSSLFSVFLFLKLRDSSPFPVEVRMIIYCPLQQSPCFKCPYCLADTVLMRRNSGVLLLKCVICMTVNVTQ